MTSLVSPCNPFSGVSVSRLCGRYTILIPVDLRIDFDFCAEDCGSAALDWDAIHRLNWTSHLPGAR